MSSRPNTRTISIVLAAMLLPLSVLAGILTSVIYKSINPSNVDITNSLAYLQQTLLIALAVGVVIGIAIVWLIINMYRKDKSFVNAKLPLILLASILVVFGAIVLLSNYNSALEDQYRTDHGQPTLQEFFDKLEENKKQ